MAKILALTGMLATTTAASGLQVTETARRREEELEAERLAKEAQGAKDLEDQAERAQANKALNEQMRADAQKEVILEVEISEAYQQWQAHVAALMAEYNTCMERGQRINTSHTIHEQVQALNDGVDGSLEQYSNFMTASEKQQLLSQLEAYNTSFADFQPDTML